MDVLSKTKKIIDLQLFYGKVYINPSFDKYFQKFYLLTNENISGYMKFINFKNKENALTVLSSGDHLFNLIHNDIINVDTFDINELTEYYAFGLKIAAILKYNYKEYENFMDDIALGYFDNKKSLEKLSQLLYDLLPYMDEKYRKYWEEIIDYNYIAQRGIRNPINLISMLAYPSENYDKYKLNNNYLLSEDDYNIFKNNLLKSNITFKNADVVDLVDNFSNKYDFIFLSNILDYIYTTYGKDWSYHKLYMLIDELKKLLKDNSLLTLSYVFNYEIKVENNSNLFFNSAVKLSDLINIETILVPSRKSNMDVRYRDGLVLKKY